MRKIFKSLWEQFKGMDQDIHSWILRRSPRTMSAIDRTLETLFQGFGHGAVGVFAALLLVVLVATNVIPIIVAVALGGAWLIAVVWLARLGPIKSLTVISRWFVTLIGGTVFAIAASAFGGWALHQISLQKAAESVKREEKPEPPKTIPETPAESQRTRKEDVPELRKKHRPSEVKKEDEPPFSVSVEWAKFSTGGKGYGTNFWIDYQSRDGCSLSPIQAIYFIRIKNLRRVPVTVVGYSADVNGIPLTRVLAKIGAIVGIPVGETIFGARIMNRLRPGDPLNFGQGPGFSMVQVPLEKSDFSRGLLLQLDLVENLLKTPLTPDIPIRGWAFFQSPNENDFTLAGPGHITLETDDSRTFSYPFDLINPHPELDVLDRTITVKSFVDLSSCKRP